MIHRPFSLRLLATTGVFCALATGVCANQEYAVVVSEKTQADAGWNEVVNTLKSKHAAGVLVFRARTVE